MISYSQIDNTGEECTITLFQVTYLAHVVHFLYEKVDYINYLLISAQRESE